jgi:hypothetical protein
MDEPHKIPIKEQKRSISQNLHEKKLIWSRLYLGYEREQTL